MLYIYILLKERLRLQPKSLDFTLTTNTLHPIPALLAIKHVIAGTAIQPHTLINLQQMEAAPEYHGLHINTQRTTIGPHTVAHFLV